LPVFEPAQSRVHKTTIQAAAGQTGLSKTLAFLLKKNKIKTLAFDLELMDSIPMTCVGGDDLASSAATPAMHLDRTFKPPLAEAIPQASLRAYPSSSSNAASSPPLFLVFCKGMASDEVVGPPGPSGVVVAVLAAAVCGPQGDVLLTVRKPVVGFVGGPDGAALLEAAALVEGLHAAHGLGIRSVKVITDHKMLHDLVCHCPLLRPRILANSFFLPIILY